MKNRYHPSLRTVPDFPNRSVNFRKPGRIPRELAGVEDKRAECSSFLLLLDSFPIHPSKLSSSFSISIHPSLRSVQCFGTDRRVSSPVPRVTCRQGTVPDWTWLSGLLGCRVPPILSFRLCCDVDLREDLGWSETSGDHSCGV